ncbi:hypothetical protein DL546_009314 [Coniochaeta pulveracea]|nr:hypothetical protein DL546_009314 [Coniochaeta pulveracea]
MLVVSTLTQACMNFDPRRAAGNQVNLFSCGGRADGGGQVTNSQLFTFKGGAGPLSLQPTNEAGSCFSAKDNTLDVAQCSSSDAKQSFTIDDGAGANEGTASGKTSTPSSTVQTATDAATSAAAESSATTFAQETDQTTADGKSSLSKCTQRTRTRTRTVTMTPSASLLGAQGVSTTAPVASATDTPSSTETVATSTALDASLAASSTSSSDAAETTTSTTAVATGGATTANPTEAVPVSRAGGVLNPTAAAESNQRDETATRAFADVEIRAPNGQCLSVDPTAGDFRQNLIPVGLVDCAGSPGEKWDVITAGKHNNAQGAALIVSSLTQGCISIDTRRPAGDTVTLFSCGGRADGGGDTNDGQLVPFIGALSFPFAPLSENNKTCILPGTAGRLDSGPCPSDLGPQLFSIFPE